MDYKDLKRHVRHIAEDRAVYQLQELGYDVTRNGHNAHADFAVNGVLEVEVKGARWTRHVGGGGRWQFNTRQQADVYILYCCGFPMMAFVIPGSAIGDRRHICITSEDPRDYNGMWTKYFCRWGTIERELERKLGEQAR